MRAVVVYESMYGNTHLIADAIGAGLGGAFEVTVVPVSRAGPAVLAGADLIVVGGPTHAHAMSRASTRKAAVQAADKPVSPLTIEPDAAGPGLREWFGSLGPSPIKAAAFDTRLHGPATLTGRASKGIAHLLRSHGFDVVAEPESFLVTKQDRLEPQETTRAREWGAKLAGAVAAGLWRSTRRAATPFSRSWSTCPGRAWRSCTPSITWRLSWRPARGCTRPASPTTALTWWSMTRGKTCPPSPATGGWCAHLRRRRQCRRDVVSTGHVGGGNRGAGVRRRGVGIDPGLHWRGAARILRSQATDTTPALVMDSSGQRVAYGNAIIGVGRLPAAARRRTARRGIALHRAQHPAPGTDVSIELADPFRTAVGPFGE